MLLNFTDIVKKYNINITGIIHIGSHRSQEVKEYLDNNVKDIIMFEPVSNNFNILEKQLSCIDVNITAHQVALGNEEKNVMMYLSDNDQMSSSVLKPKKHLEEYPSICFNGMEEVEMKMLDSFQQETKRFNFINMDVQGYELEVLKGGSKTLEHIDYVYCEVNRDEVYENNAYIGQLDEFLKDYDMERVETQ